MLGRRLQSVLYDTARVTLSCPVCGLVQDHPADKAALEFDGPYSARCGEIIQVTLHWPYDEFAWIGLGCLGNVTAPHIWEVQQGENRLQFPIMASRAYSAIKGFVVSETDLWYLQHPIFCGSPVELGPRTTTDPTGV